MNSTHCACNAGDIMCGDGLCLSNTKYCDNVKDCADGADEPPNCENCLVALNVTGKEGSRRWTGRVGRNIN